MSNPEKPENKALVQGVVLNLGDYSETATTLVKEISKAIGTFWQPHQVVRMAEAEAKAAKIVANSQIEVTDTAGRLNAS